MVTAVLAFANDGVNVGFAGTSTPLATVRVAITNYLRLHEALLKALDYLLIDLSQAHVVITEPPLLPIPTKRAIADILLLHIRIRSLAFVPQSVCCLLQKGLRHGIVVLGDRASPQNGDDRCVVPVYDARELTPLIVVSDEVADELSVANAIDRIVKRASRETSRFFADPDRLLTEPRDGGFLGASAVAATHGANGWPVLSREQYRSGERNVYDVLFDWPQSHRKII